MTLERVACTKIIYLNDFGSRTDGCFYFREKYRYLCVEVVNLRGDRDSNGQISESDDM
jgi:hypothetical protein